MKEKLSRRQLQRTARAEATRIIHWLDALDPALLKDADGFAQQLMVRTSRLYMWAWEREKRRTR